MNNTKLKTKTRPTSSELRREAHDAAVEARRALQKYVDSRDSGLLETQEFLLSKEEHLTDLINFL